MDARSRKTEIVLTVLLVGFLAALAYHYYGWLRIGQLYPRGTFLFIPSEFWGDFQSDSMYSSAFRPYEVEWRGLWAVYPPVAFLLTLPFTQVGLLCGSLFCGAVLYAVVCGGAHALLVGSYLRSAGQSLSMVLPHTIVLAFMTYPYLVAMDRGNCEFAIYLLSFGFFWMYERKRRLPALVCLALAVSAKLYPATFAVVLVRDKKWKDLLVLAVLSASLTAAAMVLFHVSPTGLVEAIQRSSPTARQYLTQGTTCVEFSTGVVPFLRAVFLFVSTDAGRMQAFAAWLMQAWTPFGIALALAMLAPIFLWRLQPWQQVALMVAVVILVPPRSADYKLLYAYIPLLMFLEEKRKQPGDSIVAALFALLMIPKAYGIIHEGVTWSVIWNPLLLVAIVIAILALHEEEGSGVAKTENVIDGNRKAVADGTR